MEEKNLTEPIIFEGQEYFPYEGGDIPFGYEICYITLNGKDGKPIDTFIKKYNWSPEEKIKQRVIYLRIKLIDGTITPEEKEELKLLI